MADVLVVEDHIDSADAIITSLRNAGHQVRHALHGEAALTSLVERAPDLIVLDLRLPVMDGIRFMDIVRSYLRWRDIPVIVVTAANDNEIARVQTLGVHHVFHKARFELADLVQKVGEVVHDSRGRATAQ